MLEMHHEAELLAARRDLRVHGMEEIVVEQAVEEPGVKTGVAAAGAQVSEARHGYVHKCGNPLSVVECQGKKL